MMERNVTKCVTILKVVSHFYLRCYCGMGYETEAMVRECKCRRKCTGNKKKRCGGSEHASFYNTCKSWQLPANILTNRAAARTLVSLQCSLPSAGRFSPAAVCMLLETFLHFYKSNQLLFDNLHFVKSGKIGSCV